MQKAHFGLTYGTVFPSEPGEQGLRPNYAEITREYVEEGVRIPNAGELLPALKAAIASGKPTVLDVAMINNPTPTSGHWNILDIYSPGKNFHTSKHDKKATQIVRIPPVITPF